VIENYFVYCLCFLKRYRPISSSCIIDASALRSIVLVLTHLAKQSSLIALGVSLTHAAPLVTQNSARLSVDFFVKQGLMRLAAGRPEEALLQAERALELNPASAEALFVRARSKHDIGLKADALADYDKALQIDPRMPKALVNRALVKAGLGDVKSAIQDLSAAIGMDPGMASAYSNRGVARGALDDRKGAVADFTKAIQLNPRYADAYRNRGIALEMLGDMKGACRDWRQALLLGQKEVKDWYTSQCANR